MKIYESFEYQQNRKKEMKRKRTETIIKMKFVCDIIGAVTILPWVWINICILVYYKVLSNERRKRRVTTMWKAFDCGYKTTNTRDLFKNKIVAKRWKKNNKNIHKKIKIMWKTAVICFPFFRFVERHTRALRFVIIAVIIIISFFFSEFS